jgi:hypothetical protein
MAGALSYGSFDALLKKMASGGVIITVIGELTTNAHFKAKDVRFTKRGQGLDDEQMKAQRLALFTEFMTNIKTYCEAM